MADNNYVNCTDFGKRPVVADRIVTELRAGRSGFRIPALAVGVPSWHCGLYLVWSTTCFDGPFSHDVVLGKYRCRLLLSGNQNYNV